jgi:hypothetical protein
MTLTPANERAMDKRVREYARAGNWQGAARVMGGNPREDLQDHIPGFDDGEPRAGAPNFV